VPAPVGQLARYDPTPLLAASGLRLGTLGTDYYALLQVRVGWLRVILRLGNGVHRQLCADGAAVSHGDWTILLVLLLSVSTLHHCRTQVAASLSPDSTHRLHDSEIVCCCIFSQHPQLPRDAPPEAVQRAYYLLAPRHSLHVPSLHRCNQPPSLSPSK
jgi:hypothetical protein